jgi:hypothetical protein
MTELADLIRAPGLTSTQVGAIGECLVAAGILDASNGRLSPFKPVADDDGMDLLLFDKENRRAIPLQIKARRSYDDEKAQTVQFDVRLKTFAREGEGYVLFLKMAGASVETFWLVPAKDLPAVARETSTNLTIMPSTKPTSNDRLTPYRMTSMHEVAARLLESARG